MTDQILGVTQAPIRRLSEEVDYPKWVTPHTSRVTRKEIAGGGVHVSVHGFEHVHVHRDDGSVTVLVHSAEDEARALTQENAA